MQRNARSYADCRGVVHIVAVRKKLLPELSEDCWCVLSSHGSLVASLCLGTFPSRTRAVGEGGGKSAALPTSELIISLQLGGLSGSIFHVNHALSKRLQAAIA